MRIDTERLVLRRWSTDDVDPLAEILLDSRVSQWLGGDGSRDDVIAAIERYEHSWETLGFGRFAVEERVTGELVGRVGIMRADAWSATPERDEVGWVIAADRWGRGYATEAARAALADGLGRVGLPRVIAFTLAENVASRRVMERCGMTERSEAEWAGRPHVWYDVMPAGGGTISSRPPN